MQLNLDDKRISYALLKKSDGDYETLVSHNLEKYYHPASLLKLFTAVMLEDTHLGVSSLNDLQNLKKIESERDLQKALLTSIKDSDNDALAFIIDILAPYEADYNLLSEGQLSDLVSARKAINKFFCSRDFSSAINLANKCFGFDYYGKEEQLLKFLGQNQIICEDLIKLLKMIENSYPKSFQAMHREIALVRTDDKPIPSSITDTQDYQVEAFAGKVLREELGITEIYSKAGWTSKVRHDAVIFDYALAKGDAPSARYILTVMTDGFSYAPDMLQKVVEFLISEYI